MCNCTASKTKELIREFAELNIELVKKAKRTLAIDAPKLGEIRENIRTLVGLIDQGW